MASEVEALVKKILPTLDGKVQLDSTLLSSLCSAIRANLGAEQKELALQVLRAVVAKWQQGKGVVQPSFEVEATYELAIAAVFSDNKAAAVETTMVSCWDHFVSVFCRQVSAEVPNVVKKVDELVDKASVPSEVKEVVEHIVDAVAKTVETVAADAVAAVEPAAVAVAAPPAADAVATVAVDLSGGEVPVVASAPAVEKVVENKKKHKVQA